MISSGPPKKVDKPNATGNEYMNAYSKGKCGNLPGYSFGNTNTNIPVITSFAMKEEETSPDGLAGENGNNFNQIISPKDVSELFSHLKGEKFSKIKYSAYRAALKIDALQKGLCLDIVRLGTVVGVFHQHGLGLPLGPVTSRGTTPNFINGGNKNIPYNHDDIIIEKQKAADIISGIFFSAGKVTLFCINSITLPSNTTDFMLQGTNSFL